MGDKLREKLGDKLKKILEVQTRVIEKTQTVVSTQTVVLACCITVPSLLSGIAAAATPKLSQLLKIFLPLLLPTAQTLGKTGKKTLHTFDHQ